MVGQDLKRLMFLVIGWVLIIGVCHINVAYDPTERYEQIMAKKRAQYSTELKAAELREFMQLWPEYKKIGSDNDFYTPYLDVLPENALNWKQRMWFRHHYVEPNRFFYVQQRLIYILQALDIRRDSAGVIDLLSQNDEELCTQMVELQKKRAEFADISVAETVLVSTKEREIRELLK